MFVMTSKHKALQAKYFSIIAELGIASPFHFDQKGESSVCFFYILHFILIHDWLQCPQCPELTTHVHYKI